MNATIKTETGKVKVPIPDGYRRVVNGYTRDGDLAYVLPEERGEFDWEGIPELHIISDYNCVIRPIGGKK